MQKKQYEKNAKITVKSLAHFRRTGHNMGANEKKQGTLTTTPIFVNSKILLFMSKICYSNDEFKKF